MVPQIVTPVRFLFISSSFFLFEVSSSSRAFCASTDSFLFCRQSFWYFSSFLAKSSALFLLASRTAWGCVDAVEQQARACVQSIDPWLLPDGFQGPHKQRYSHSQSDVGWTGHATESGTSTVRRSGLQTFMMSSLHSSCIFFISVSICC